MAAMLFALGASGALRAQTPVVQDSPGLRPGDALRITVWRKPELSGDFQVAADGAIKHPLYRELHVLGLGTAELNARLGAFLASYEANPQFTVEPLFRVAVGGEVRKPDLYTLPAETTISQALAMAGGPGDQGRLDRVTLVRNARAEVLDLSRPETGAASWTIRSGDEILVGRKHVRVREVLAPVASVVTMFLGVFNLFYLR